MFFILGTEKAKIKKTTDHGGACTNCSSSGLAFEVFRNYYHLFWIPLFPIGGKESKVSCTTCGESNNYNPRVKHVESSARTPFYLYAGPIIFLVLVGLMVFANISTQKEKALFIADPQVGDVYLIRKDANDSVYYHFLRVASIQEDTVTVYSNTLQYLRFVTKLDDDDYFVRQGFPFTKKELKALLEKGEINSVERGYDDAEGFNRIQDIELDSIQ